MARFDGSDCFVLWRIRAFEFRVGQGVRQHGEGASRRDVPSLTFYEMSLPDVTRCRRTSEGAIPGAMAFVFVQVDSKRTGREFVTHRNVETYPGSAQGIREIA